MSAVVSSAEYRPLIGKSTLTDANLRVGLRYEGAYPSGQVGPPSGRSGSPIRARRLDPFKNPPAQDPAMVRTVDALTCRFGVGEHVVSHHGTFDTDECTAKGE
jgi:hypothetical protein